MYLITLLSLSISFLGTANASWEKTKSHEGYDQYLISGGGKPVFEVTIFHGTETGRQVADELLRPYIAKDDKVAAYELTPAMVDRVLSTLQMTADMVGRNKTSTDPILKDAEEGRTIDGDQAISILSSAYKF